MASSDPDSDVLFRYGVLTLYLMCPPTFIALRFLQAPYGKHNRPGWGPSLSPPLAWFLMESPTLWVPALVLKGKPNCNPKALLLFSPFLLHYLNRTLLYPLRLLHTGSSGHGFPVSVAGMAFGFNLLNAYVQASWVFAHKDYAADSFFWWRFAGGFALFAAGMAVNVRSDAALVRLKREGGGGYRLPRGGLFHLVSCPNYFGEMLEWLGWAVMGASPPGLAFFLYTCANLVPRARANHRWYRDKFGEDYPKNRKAVIPYLY